MSGRNLIMAALAAFAALAAGAVVLPDWAMFLFAMALAKGLVCLGIVVMMRGGLVSFGHGLYYCLGAYTATLLANAFGVTDILLLSLASALVCLAVGAAFGPLLASYRGIFFAMLSMALSMVLYGSLSKMSIIGGSDGLNIAAPTFLGWAPEGRSLQMALYLYVAGLSVILGAVMRRYFDSEQGPGTTSSGRCWAALAARSRRSRSAMWTRSSPSGQHQASSCSWRSWRDTSRCRRFSWPPSYSNWSGPSRTSTSRTPGSSRSACSC
jgi:ABC-type branched-subunit amino acid transport system permease subunit